MAEEAAYTRTVYLRSSPARPANLPRRLYLAL